MARHTHNIFHCSATREGMNFGKDDILRWHMGPKKLSEGYKYKNKVYKSLSDIPHEKIGGKYAADIKGGRGWSRPGYSKLILLDGKIEKLWRTDDDGVIDQHEMTWGAYGMNAVAKHFCYIGGLSKDGKVKDTRNKEQLLASSQLVFEEIDGNPLAKWSGHNQHNKTSCPSFFVPDWLESLNVDPKNVYYGKL